MLIAEMVYLAQTVTHPLLSGPGTD